MEAWASAVDLSGGSNRRSRRSGHGPAVSRAGVLYATAAQLPMQPHPRLLHSVGHLRNPLPRPAGDPVPLSSSKRGMAAGRLRSLIATCRRWGWLRSPLERTGGPVARTPQRVASATRPALHHRGIVLCAGRRPASHGASRPMLSCEKPPVAKHVEVICVGAEQRACADALHAPLIASVERRVS